MFRGYCMLIRKLCKYLCAPANITEDTVTISQRFHVVKVWKIHTLENPLNERHKIQQIKLKLWVSGNLNFFPITRKIFISIMGRNKRTSTPTLIPSKGSYQCISYTDVAPAGPATPLFQASQNFSMLDPCLLPYIAIYPLKLPLKPLKTSKAPQNRQESHNNVKILPQPPRGPP